MTKAPMYLILAISMGIGGYLPSLFGQSLLSVWAVFGTVIGGVIGVVLYAKARKAGYID